MALRKKRHLIPPLIKRLYIILARLGHVGVGVDDAHHLLVHTALHIADFAQPFLAFFNGVKRVAVYIVNKNLG